jgi:1,2-beta-oligoglucan phosphorylase
MPSETDAAGPKRLAGAAGLSIEIHDDGGVRRLDCGDLMVNLFVGNAVERAPANLWLRAHAKSGPVIDHTPLLGPGSATHGRRVARGRWVGAGEWRGLRYCVALQLSQSAPAWFWQVTLENAEDSEVIVDLIHTQDLALAPYSAVRMNEYYVSQYIDHSPLQHASHGWIVASRQNLAAAGRNPWCMIGSLRRGSAFATDALQVHGLASRAGAPPAAMLSGLPSLRLQHEHSMAAIQDEPVTLPPRSEINLGFFGAVRSDHPGATSRDDLAAVNETLALPEAVLKRVEPRQPAQGEVVEAAALFTTAPLLAAQELDVTTLRKLFPGKWRHKETDAAGWQLSFFYEQNRHVVLREKELRVQRPHGHLLRTGRRAIPDESALTSTVWMAGVFHSMLTQGHVSINRFLSTVHGYIGLFRSHGQRIFIDSDSGDWQLLDVPSAFEMSPTACRWIYQHVRGVLEVRSEARSEPHEMLLTVRVLSGPPVRCLISHHIALNGDDGSTVQPVLWSRAGDEIRVRPAVDSDLGRRFPSGGFSIAAAAGTRFERTGGDELLFADDRSHGLPYICVVTAASTEAGLRLRGHLVETAGVATDLIEESCVPTMTLPATAALAAPLQQLSEILPWFAHNALIHYLSPRGLEQYSGGGWGTRDVTQGPVEMLLALGNTQPVRDLLLRVMSAQNADGDWPQWFMFFDRERNIRAGDSHGDIVFWPVLALAQYLIASGDASVLQEPVPFFAEDKRAATHATVWEHVQRALALIDRRIIHGSVLAAYGHGDWNDSLQPADPAMREHMCSAWTVTLHHQVLVTFARALRTIGQAAQAEPFEAAAAAVREDFQRLLLVDGVLTGYAMFDAGDVRYLLHPRDQITGVRYSSLAMIHAILEGMFTPAQALEHLELLRTQLSGPDGVRLFDRPMQYHGGPQRFFQRAESATFFGREIGLMYMHAHLRYAQALAHMGEADAFFRALCQANPIGIGSIVPTASPRQVNCYYSSSDAAFADRYQASREYDAVVRGEVALDGGWRVYSSGAGIALGLIVRRLLGLSVEYQSLCIDPVMPAALNGLKASMSLLDHDVEVTYQVSPPGYGVSSATINGQQLTLSHDANPYRRGAARTPMGEFARHLRPGRNLVTIALG